MKGQFVNLSGGVANRAGISIRALAGSTALALTLAATPCGAQQGSRDEAGQARETRQFNVPAQPLTSAVTAFGDQAGIQVTVDGSILSGLTSTAVSGTLSLTEALSRLLNGTGITFRWINGNSIALERVPQTASDDGSAIQLDTLRIEGAGTVEHETGTERDMRGRDEVYDLDLSTTFASREEVERYKGVNTADVLKGMVNVFSGDARNGGALDPSIRGVQGPGRVPVIIDGTEQALTVWRGYNGASNRNYIDPSLISDVQVLKGPVSIRGVNGSTGGAVVINTLDADDILDPGQTFGIELRLEGGNNSTNPRLPTLLTGQDYRDIPGFTTGGIGPTYPYGDPSLRVNLRTEDDNEAFSFGDRAIRIAAAGWIGDFDLFGAYAFRERGNYFSGKTAADYYQQEDLAANLSDNYVRRLGLNYEPGNEIPNTSSELESFLLKGAWRIADDQYLQLGFRDSRTKFGEIMPSRVFSGSVDSFGNVQWPLSKVHLRAYNAEYKWQPESRWIDLKANLWATDTVSDTYSAGGFPNSASLDDPILINSAVSNADNDRYGFTASNRFSPTATLDFLLEGSWQHEKLRSDDEYTDAVANGWRQFPRAGRREEYRINFSGEWRPAPFLKLNAGLTYSGYWAKDDFLPELLERRGGSITQYVTPSYSTSYRTEHFGVAEFEDYIRADYAARFSNVPPELFEAFLEPIILAGIAAYTANPYTFYIDQTGTDWLPDESGDFRRTDNICLNGSLDALADYATGSCVVSANNMAVAITEANRRSGHGWAPAASATVYLSGSSRAYLRYAQAYRSPSMFESTIGFSASLNPLADLKPERIHSWEAAFIQDLRPLFNLNGAHQHADLKLTWYHNTTHDVIERDSHLQFSNLDKQAIAGFELQARYDNGGFFADLSAGHMTTNKVCDESVAATMDPSRGRVPDCVKYGFLSSFLLTQATPEESVNLTLGGRFFERRLEVGGRLTWYSKYYNPQLDEFTDPDDCVGGCVLNIPYTWDEILTFDAYAKFRINDRFSAELTGLNLNNRYYLDPLSRSLLPAPGRTVRLSLTRRF